MFSSYNLQFPSESTLRHIYISIISGHFEVFPDEIKDITDPLIQLTLDLYKVSLFKLYFFYFDELTKQNAHSKYKFVTKSFLLFIIVITVCILCALTYVK